LKYLIDPQPQAFGPVSTLAIAYNIYGSMIGADDDLSSNNIEPAALSKPAAQRIIKELGSNADNIVALPHCVRRMVQRKISITQLRLVVQGGFIDGDPWFDHEHASWRVMMRGFSAGAQLTIASPSNGNRDC
jgi:hypothetical protein